MITSKGPQISGERIGLTGLLTSLGVYAALNFWIIFSSNAYALLNDFWFLNQISDRFTWSNPSALYDSFFPYLFPFLLKFVPSNSILLTTALISLIASIFTIIFIFFAARLIVGPLWALIAVWIVALQPQSFTYATVPGADALAALPVAAALWVLIREWKNPEPHYMRALVISGILLGVGASFRYHVLILATIPLILALTLNGKRLQALSSAALGLLAGYFPQVVVNAAAGELPWSTLQGFNVYRQVATVDWNTTDSLDPSQYTSALAVMTNNPVAFSTNYLNALTNFVFPLVVIALAVSLLQNSRWRSLAWSFFASSTLFVLLTSTAFSDRTLIVFTPIWALAAAVVFARLSNFFIKAGDYAGTLPKLRPVFRTALGALSFVLLLWGTLPWLQADLSSGIARHELEKSRTIYESEFLASVNVSSMSQVFSNDFFFYTTEVEGFVPQHNGGLAAISQKGTEMAPAVNLSNPESFLCESLKRDFQATVWNPGNGSGADPALNDILSGVTPDEQIIARSTLGLVVSEIKLNSDPCA